MHSKARDQDLGILFHQRSPQEVFAEGKSALCSLPCALLNVSHPRPQEALGLVKNPLPAITGTT